MHTIIPKLLATSIQPPLLLLEIAGALSIVVAVILLFLFIGLIAFITSFYRKVPQGRALVRTGAGGTKVAFDTGMVVLPVIHISEIMDISVKKIEIQRLGKDGLICKDNLRADIKVVFFVRVDKSSESVKKVAGTIGCERASDIETLVTLFEAKFSEALKTVGKRFELVDLYDSREKFKEAILNTIGTDLNGYVLDDCAIDYLEQTPMSQLSESNIFDAQGIKKITDLTAQEKVKANFIRREEEKTITKQNVDAREAILELERQLAEKEEMQRREIATIKSRESAEIEQVAQQQRLKAERAKIQTEEELQVAEQNKQRQVIVAEKSKERTEAIETEKLNKERDLEITEREKIVALAQIEKEKAVEEERKNIQDVIRERVAVEREVVEEEEKIKDTKAQAEADRNKKVALTVASQKAEESLVKVLKEAEASKLAAEWEAQQRLINAQAAKDASVKDAESKKILAEARAAEEAALGISEAQVMEAKAKAREQEGAAEARIIEQLAVAEAKSIELKAEADQKRGTMEATVLAERGLAEAKVIEQKALAEAKGQDEKGLVEARVQEAQGLAEAKVIEQKALAQAKGLDEKGTAEAKVQEALALAEAKGIKEKAEAMKELDGVGKEHEEFKLRLDKDKAIELAAIHIQQAIAESQAKVIAEALKAANIDIVGGDTNFFDNIIQAVTRGKAIDKTVNSSQTLQAIGQGLMNGNGGNVLERIQGLMSDLNLNPENVKNLTLTALLIRILGMTATDQQKSLANNLLETVKTVGIGDKKVGNML